MARRMCAEGDEKVYIKDAEIGIHFGNCRSPLCCSMKRVYSELLRPSTVDDSDKIKRALLDLEHELMEGKEVRSLRGKPSHFYDPVTGEQLKLARAFDITEKCRLSVEDKALLVYINSLTGMMVNLQEISQGKIMNAGFNLNSELFTPHDLIFKRYANSMGIDSQFLHAVIFANVPKVPRRILK